LATYDIARDTAVQVLIRVLEEGAYLDVALDKALRRRAVKERGRRFLTHLAYGTARHKLLCDFVLEQRLHQPLDDLPPAIRTILRMGVFQALFCSQVTFPSMVNTSVDLAKHRGHAGTARLVNAVLRRVPQNLEEVQLPPREKGFARHLSIRYSLPEWLVAEWIAEHGEAAAETLCAASNEEAPATLRANTLKISAENLIVQFNEAASKAGKPPMASKRTNIPEEVTLAGHDSPPTRSKRFDQGNFLIQDAASMLPPHLLEPKPGEMILDLCAAPGGKTTHIAQLTEGGALVVGLDSNAGKLAWLLENAARLSVPDVVAVCGDGTTAPLTPLFDRVLVDAPCTGLGTLRRHPDLKWRTTPEARARLARVQLELLRCGIGLCKNGGLVVYSVCTFSQTETHAVVDAISKTERVTPEDGPEWLNQWKISKGRYRTLPTNAGLDGFFLTRLRKAS